MWGLRRDGYVNHTPSLIDVKWECCNWYDLLRVDNHPVCRQVEVLLRADDLPDLGGAQGKSCSGQLVITHPHQGLLLCKEIDINLRILGWKMRLMI